MGKIQNPYAILQGVPANGGEFARMLRGGGLKVGIYHSYSSMGMPVNALIVSKNDVKKAAQIFDDEGYIDKEQFIKGAKKLKDVV